MFQVWPFIQKQILINVYCVHVGLSTRVEVSTVHSQTLIETCQVLDIVLGSGYSDKEDEVPTLMELVGFKRESFKNK